MTRLGAAILLGIVVAIVGFASMLSFGAAPAPVSGSAAADGRTPADGTSTAAGGLRDGLRVPVAGIARSALEDSWGTAREGGLRAHHGIDIMAPAGTPVAAASDGTVEKLFRSLRGGVTLYQRSPDRRWSYYYAHLAGYAPGVREGARVRAGQVLGYVGDSGNAGAGNYHLHFGVARMRVGERWWQGENVNPYPLLARPRAGR